MKKILLFVFLISTAYTLFAQNGYWEEAKGPYGGGEFNITKTSNGTFYASPKMYFTGSMIQHIYRSDDNGQTWNGLSLPPGTFLDSLPKHITIGNAGTFFLELFNGSPTDSQFYISTDEGQNWIALESGITKIDETESGALICCKWNTGVWKSTDGGQSWVQKLANTAWEKGVITPFGELLVVDGYRVSYSQDNGDTWTQFFMSNDLGPIEHSFFTPIGTILVITPVDSLYRSTDGGQTFTAVMSTDHLYNPTFIKLNSGRILMQFEERIDSPVNHHLYYSDDDGISWQTLVTAQEGAGGAFIPINPLSDGTIFKQYLDALLRSVDGGLTWQFSGTGIRSATELDMKFISNSLYYALNRIGLWKTTDAGENWLLLTNNAILNDFDEKNFAITPNGGIAVFQDNKLLWSSDYGGTFTDITPDVGLFRKQFVFINPYDGALFVSSKGIKKSVDSGQSWTTILPNDFARGMVFHSSGRIIANCLKNILMSDDGGDTWSIVEHPAGWQDAGAIASLATNGTIYFSDANQSLWRSKDAGETWVKLPLAPDQWILDGESLVIASNGHLYFSDGYEDVLLSVDEGASWQTLPEDFHQQQLSNLALSPNQRLFIGTRDDYSRLPRLYQSSSLVTQGAYIEGYVRVDADADCSTPDAQAPLKNKGIKADGENYSYLTNTDAGGHYILFVDTGAYQVIIQSPNGVWWDYCEDTASVELPDLFVTDTVDFVAIPLSYCPLMTVNLGIPQLRRCFDNEVYVEYCNQGTEPADSAWVDVMLDPYLSLVSSAQPHEDLGGNAIRFFVGNLPSGECGNFQLTVHVDCDSTVLGQTHCIMAHGFPDTLCTTVPNWSGANIEASVTCQDSTLKFHLKNTGNAHSQTLDYIIIEDEVVLMSGQQDYDIAEDVILDVPANGSTWRIESEQEPGHPFSNLALAFAEGCGGFNSLGFINQFTVNGIQPSWHRMCVENTGSFDPNDKQGFPTGTGSEHNIRPGQTLDYLIRFQNTGTDTAFTVLVRDTLSPFLDPLSIRPGASSHPYTWDLSGQGVITFSFNNIMLPDSNVNEPRSHGFVQFSIAPYADVPLGSVLENDAAIYFDFNEPVITNTTWHTIQKSPLSGTFQPVSKTASAGLEVWPNPFNERTIIHLDLKTGGILLLKVFNSTGDLVAQKSAVGSDIELNAKHLPAGLYWAEVRNAKNDLLGKGKLLRQ